MRDRNAKLKVIQIIPADRWFARYTDASQDSSDNVYPLACWALVENETGERWVEGMDNASDGVALAPDTTNFIEYVHTSEIQGETWYAKYHQLLAQVEADQKSH